MTEKQLLAVRYAFADMCGALQAYRQGDIHVHDWEAHWLTIQDMKDAFDFLDPIPEDCR
jgi:hypothetical protein